MFNHFRATRNVDTLRHDLIAASEKYADTTPLDMESCSLDVKFSGNALSVSSEMQLKNSQDVPADSALLSLNPGLQISRVASGEQTAEYLRDGHILVIKIPEPLEPEKTFKVQIDYSGVPEEAYCYPEIDGKILKKAFKTGSLQCA